MCNRKKIRTQHGLLPSPRAPFRHKGEGAGGEGLARKKQHGFSLILVLFLLVVVSMLVVAMARLNSGGQQAVSQEILSVRAFWAAESGAQAMAMRTFLIDGAVPIACPADFSINFPAAATGLNGCAANVSCQVVSAAGRTVFTVSSIGTCDGGTERSSRRIDVALRAL